MMARRLHPPVNETCAANRDLVNLPSDRPGKGQARDKRKEVSGQLGERPGEAQYSSNQYLLDRTKALTAK